MNRFVLLLLAAGILAACQDPDLTQPGPTQLRPTGIAADLEQRDGFRFLSPLGQPASGLELGTALRTRVQICVWDSGGGPEGAGACVEPLLASFAGAEISVEDDMYKVEWDVGATPNVVTGQIYRISVLAAGSEGGFVEVVIGENRREARQLEAQTGAVGLVRNQTVPIRYGIDPVVYCETVGGCTTATVTSTAEATVTNEDQTVGAEIPAGAIPADVGEVTLIIEEVELAPDEECLSETSIETVGGCVSYTTDPELTDGFDGEVVVGICFDRNAVPNPENFLIHRFDPDDPGGGVEALPAAPTPFLDCDSGALGAADTGPIRRLAQAGWRTLAGFIGPRPLLASDEGFGGTTSRFSNFQWAEAVEVTAMSRTEQEGVAGGAAPASPTVLVSQAHDGTAPVSGVDVAFELTDASGNVTTVVATSGQDGIATIPWPLGSTGLHTAVATAPGAPEPASFTAEAGTIVLADAGERHTCALLSTGGILCWGSNGQGRLGTGSGDPGSTRPVQIAGTRDYIDVAAGGGHTCAVAETHQVFCWGVNSSGQLGDGTTAESAVPVAVQSGESFTTVAAGLRHTCALASSGQAYCWGENPVEQLGTTAAAETCSINSNTRPCSTTPLPVQNAPAFAHLSVGLSTSCALTPGGEAYCWGWNNFGALGIGDLAVPHSLPVAVDSDETFTTLSTGAVHSCAVTAAGVAWCWGINAFGQVGATTPDDRAASPVPVQTQQTFRAVSASEGNNLFGHSCGIATDGGMHCWGADFNHSLATSTQLQGCTFNDFNFGCAFEPVPSAAGITFGDVLDTSTNYTCGLSAGGELFCWGQNDEGQLGDGTTTNAATPVRALP